MNAPEKLPMRWSRTFWVYTFALAAAWTMVAVASLAWNLYQPLIAPGARGLAWVHLGLWAFGLSAISLAARRLHLSMRQQQEAEARLVHLSTHDALTGVHNRTYFEQVLVEMVDRGCNPVSVIVADVDHLKEVNDSLGHPAGDLLILAAASLLREHFRDDDIIARIGGDEFVVILPCTEASKAAQILERVRTSVTAGIPTGDGSPSLSLSLGSATTEDAAELLEIFKQADQEMYADKARKKRRREEPAKLRF